MLYRRSRKSSAIFLTGVMTLFWWQSMVYPVYGNYGSGAESLLVTGVRNSEISIVSFLFSPIVSLKTSVIPKQAPPQTVEIQFGEDEVAKEYPEGLEAPSKEKDQEQDQEQDREAKMAPTTPQYTKEEVELLARIIHGEARGENFEGQVAVGAVVINRLQDPRFPKTLREVIYQENAFTAIKDRQFNLKPDERAFQAAEAALSGKDPTDGALYYYNPQTAKDRWIRTRPVVKQIGNHRFGI